MSSFQRHKDCKECGLCEGVISPGLPTRAFEPGYPKKDRAVIFLGQSPGLQDDRQGTSFLGFVGGLLSLFIKQVRVTDYADVYLANAIRCRPPQGANETQSQIKKCRAHLVGDIKLLQETYQEIIVMCLGAKACYAAANISSINEGLKKQGTVSTVFQKAGLGDIKLFFTNNPAILHKSRQPAKAGVLESHFVLLIRYLVGFFIPNGLAVTPEIGKPPPQKLASHIGIDIETYGILRGVEQTVFNPHKSKWIDGIPYKDQVVTIGFGWIEDDPRQPKTYTYIWGNPAHRRYIREWFKRMVEQGCVAVGQNFKFDLLYLLCSEDHTIAYWVDPARLRVDDTLVLAFLLFEQQPEKGLKELATLFGIYDYSTLEVTGSSGTASSAKDPKLHLYQAVDCAVTIILYNELLRRIKDKYGSGNPKLSRESAWTRNMAVWDVVDLELNGSTLSVDCIQRFHDKLTSQVTRIEDVVARRGGLKLSGRGSDAPLREFMRECVNVADLFVDDRVIYSQKTGKISIGVENVNLVSDHMPPGKSRTTIKLFQKVKQKSKLIDTYTSPLLTKPRQGILYTENGRGFVCPGWFPVPLYEDRGGGSGDKPGGQIQGRFSCTKPARQTEPHTIRKASCSRWEGGQIVEFDVSQDHLRMAAILSGDPVLLETYSNPNSESLHTVTARAILPDCDPDSYGSVKAWKKTDAYMLGKTVNIARLFGAGAATCQNIALHDNGLDLPLSIFIHAISAWRKKFAVYAEWQEKHIQDVTKVGYCLLPTGWGRTFGPPGSDMSAFHSEILNHIHQAPCAQITQSAHYQILTDLRRNRLKSRCCLNIYDAIFIDIYPGEREAVLEIAGAAMSNPPLLKVFTDWAGNSVEWRYEVKENYHD